MLRGDVERLADAFPAGASARNIGGTTLCLGASHVSPGGFKGNLSLLEISHFFAAGSSKWKDMQIGFEQKVRVFVFAHRLLSAGPSD